MPGSAPSSKQRYEEYLRQRTEKIRTREDVTPPKAGAKRAWTDDVTPGGVRRANRPFRTLLVEYLKLLHGHRARTFFALGTLSLATLIGLVFPMSTKIAFDYILLGPPAAPGPAGIPAWVPLGSLRQNPMALLWLLGAGLVGLAVLAAAIGTSGRHQMTRLTKITQAEMRRKLFDHLARLPLTKLQQLKSGGVTSILREDAGMVGEMLFSVLYNPLRAVISFGGGLIALATIDWRMLIGGLALVPAVYFTHRTWIGRIRPAFRTIKITRQNADAHATETFLGIRVVRAFGRQRGENSRFARQNHLQARQEMLAWWWSRGIEIVWTIFIPTASAVVLVYGGSRMLKHTLSIGDVVAFTAYLLMLLGPLELLVGTASSLQNGLAGFDRCLDVLAEPTEFAEVETDNPISVTKAGTHGRLTIRDVSFAYPGQSRNVLEHITLDVQAGETIALVGASGSGKSTLCNLVARFFDPTEGSVSLDGRDLRQIDVDSYRRLLGIVEQDVFLFDGTIAENIAYASRDATPEQIVAAAKVANADEFITATEKGYETIIGERGVRLSGGQKQRLTIARAVLADPKILILDEATSNLDSQSERLIQQSLDVLMRGRTCFVIAHRLSTIRHASRIVVLEQGKIAEIGTHEELKAREGLYWEMLQVQLHQSKDYAGSEGANGTAAPVNRANAAGRPGRG